MAKLFPLVLKENGTIRSHDVAITYLILPSHHLEFAILDFLISWPKPQKTVQIDSKIIKMNKRSKLIVMTIHFFTKGKKKKKIQSSKSKAVKIFLPWKHQIT